MVALGQPEKARADARSRSTFQNRKTVLTAGEIARPVDVVRLLVSAGISLQNAHDILDRLAAGENVVLELALDEKLIQELHGLGVLMI